MSLHNVGRLHTHAAAALAARLRSSQLRTCLSKFTQNNPAHRMAWPWDISHTINHV